MVSNVHLIELHKRMLSRYSKDSIEMTMGDWICENTHLRGRPFSFDEYSFQKQITDDMHPNMDVIKPSQVGLSEVQIRKAMAFITRNRETSLIFTMPNEAMFKRISTTRILPIANQEKVFNPELNERPVRSRGLIQIGGSFLYVTGATEGDATSISADVVFNDEIDLTDSQILVLFNSRMQNSNWKINQRFSTPSFISYGIDQGYRNSDQNEYMIRCDSCNHWQVPLFTPPFVHIDGLSSDMNDLIEIDQLLVNSGRLDLEGSYFKCERCSGALDLGRIDNREWVAKYPSRNHHRGYQVRPTSTGRLTVNYMITQLLKYKQRDYIRGFHNTVLGEASKAGDARLTDADILPCMGRIKVDPIDYTLPTWLGIDIGQTCHLIISQGSKVETQKTILFQTIPANKIIERIKEINDLYNLIGGAVDRHPYTPTADEIMEVTQNKIIPVEYRGDKAINFIKDIEGNMIHVQVNRTIFLDTVVRVIRKKLILLEGYGTQKTIIADHLKDMIRDEKPKELAVWKKISGNDHYFHALGFLLVSILIKEIEFGLEEEERVGIFIGGVDIPGIKSSVNEELKKNSNRRTTTYQ